MTSKAEPAPPAQKKGSHTVRAPIALPILVAVCIAAGGAYYWWQHHQPLLLAGISVGNGRIEADKIDIDTKFAGRVAQVLIDEGDTVTTGQVVARMDTRDLEASLGKDEALARQARSVLDNRVANINQQKTIQDLAKVELDRTAVLLRQGYATRQLSDQQQQQLNAANASVTMAFASLAEAAQALDAAQHTVALDRVNIADGQLVAPRDGRIQYRISNSGEVLPAGGKVYTMIDLTYVYMDIYLPTADAGRIRLGGDARIVLDAIPTIPLPAKVTFLATEAQFTPKAVETKDERDKLMFRVRVRIDPERLIAAGSRVKTGLPGLAYVLLDPAAPWPPQLQTQPVE
jgi:HlyD family secretion protein